MRNNVNSNGLINGGYTTNNQTVLQVPFYNPEIQTVQLNNGPYISSQPYIGSPQQIPYQNMYNQIPNYYNISVMGYPTQPSVMPYGQLLMTPNGYPSPIASSGLNIVDPNTGNHINLSQSNTPVTPKRKSTLQIIDPTTKSEIDVTKIVSESQVCQNPIQEESLLKQEKAIPEKEFKFNFEIEKEHDDSSVSNEPTNGTGSVSFVQESKIESAKEQCVPEEPLVNEASEIACNDAPEVNVDEASEISLNQCKEEQTEIIVDIPEEKVDDRKQLEELEIILQEIKQGDDDDDFTEVVSKKRKNKQSKLVPQETKVAEKPKLPPNRRDNSYKSNNGPRKDNRENNISARKENTANAEPKRVETAQEEQTDATNNQMPPPARTSTGNERNNSGFARKDVPRNDNLNTNGQRNYQNNERFNRNDSRNRNAPRYENKNYERNGFRNNNNQPDNQNVQRHESRITNNNQQTENHNAGFQGNESRNPSIQRTESRNSSIQRNASRNPSIQRNESRNPSIQRNESRNASIQRNESRNASIQRNESRNPSIQRNESRNPSIQRNESRNHSGQENDIDSRSRTIQQNEHQNLPMNNGRRPNGPYKGNHNAPAHRNDDVNNRFAQPNGNNQGYQRNENRGRNAYRNDDYNGHRNTYFNKNINGNHRDDRGNSRQTVMDNVDRSHTPTNDQESNILLNKVALKQPLVFQRAYRKCSSPLFTGELATKPEIAENPTPVEIAKSEIEDNQTIEEISATDIDNDQLCNDHVDASHVDTVVELVDPVVSVEQDVESQEVDIVDESVIMVEADPSPTIEIEPEQPLEEVEMIEATPQEEQATVDIVVDDDSTLEDGEIKDDATDIDMSTGRLIYYRDDMLALRATQGLPEQLYSDPSLIDVITIKIQLINFLKKREIQVKTAVVNGYQYGRTDYLDFTRKHHHIRPKRLVRGDNGYLPPKLRVANEDQMNLLKRSIKSILNKMTPENFDICTSDIVHLNIDEEANMRCLIDEIFSKAIQEESYSSTYAKFCQHMCAARVGKETFKSLLLKSCQTMFEKALHLQLDEVRQLWETKAAEETDEKMKKLYEADIEEQVKKAKDKYFGNIRFFSELFLTGQLSGRIIISCAERLLKYENDANSLEAACKLIQICGKQLELKENERRSEDKKFSKIMNQLIMLSNKAELEPRLRFKMKDVVDMRDRNWELRGIQKAITNIPKTLDEIKDDRTKEELEKARAVTYNNNHNANNNNNSSNNNRQYNQPRYPVNNRPVMDTRKLQMNSQNLSKDTILGPEIRTQWGSGCKSNTTTNNGWSSVQSSNRRAAATEEVVPADKPSVAAVKLQNKYAQLVEEQEVDNTPVDNAPVAKVDNDETVAKEIFDLIMKNTSPVNRWKEIFNPVATIEKWFDVMFNRKKECRVLLGDYFHDVIVDGLLTFDQLLKGAASTMESIDDLINDVPLFWHWLPEFLERFIRNENSNVAFIMDLFSDLDDQTKNVEKCMRLVKEFSTERLGGDVVENLFRKYQQ